MSAPQADPYTSIAAFNAAQGTLGGPQVGHTVYLLAGTGTGVYAEADGINLLNGQILTGVATGAVRPTIGPPPATASTSPRTTTSRASTSATPAAPTSPTAAARVGTLTITDVGSSGTGQIVDIDQGGTLNVTLNGADSTRLDRRRDRPRRRRRQLHRHRRDDDHRRP